MFPTKTPDYILSNRAFCVLGIVIEEFYRAIIIGRTTLPN